MGERRWGNFSSCCRLCLAEELGTLKSIFEDATLSKELVKNIRSCAEVDVQANDKLSTMICDDCLGKVKAFYNFKKLCSENQAKLVEWMNTWNSSNLADMSIQIKDEVVEDGEVVGTTQAPLQIVVDDNEVVRVKAEPIDNTYEAEPMEGDMYDLPPPLTPHPPDEGFPAHTLSSDDEDDEDDVDKDGECRILTSTSASSSYMDVSEVNGLANNDDIMETSQINDGRNCRFCDKGFSSAGNRRKHENMIHRRKDNENRNTIVSNGAQHSQGSSAAVPRTRGVSGSEAEIQKIQFAAGLQLQQRSANSKQQVSVENTPLTKIEISYLEKCKTIVKMTETLTCACHNEGFGDVKDLYAHLKKQRTWFAMFTCYNCLITFGDRSAYMKHYCHCQKPLLQNLKRLSECPVNPKYKMRLYQSYKCIKCSCIFSFHEDFNNHFDVEHMEMMQDSPPYICLCSKSFNEVESYKHHLHILCFLRIFCDICFGVFPDTVAFQNHCEREHDSADGNTLESFDTFHKCKLVNQDAVPTASTSKRSLPSDSLSRDSSDSNQITERRRTINLPVSSGPDLSTEDVDYVPEAHKVYSLYALRNIKSSKPTSCPACNKAYSSYHNMLRHYKLAHDETGRILMCMYCPEKFRLITELKEHEAALHAEELEKDGRKTPVNSGRRTPAGRKTPTPLRRQSPTVGEKSTPSVSGRKTPNQFNFSCPDCGDLFKSLEEWQEHIDTHPKKTCSECGKQFSLQSELDQHRSAHLNIKVYRDAKTQDYKVSPTLICEICDKTFNTKSELRQHRLLHEKMPVLSAHDSVSEEKKDLHLHKKYSCVECNKHYVSYGGIWDHNKKYHSGQQPSPGEYPRRCDECMKILTSRGAWVNHKRMHERLHAREASPDRAESDASPIVLQNRLSKPRVTRTSDDSESYYTCKKCFKVFSSKCNLRNHMKCHGIVLNPTSRSSSKTGKIIKNYWCDVCHQACPSFTELQEHKQEHLNENMPNLTNQVEGGTEQRKPVVFSCDICTLAFTTNFALRRHREKHVMDQADKPKQVAVYCKYCKIPFENLDELNDHMAVEHDQPIGRLRPPQPIPQPKTSGRKFPCGLCKKVFDNSGALSSHQGWHKRGKFGKKILKSQEKVVRNMLNQAPTSPEPSEANRYQCYTCSQQFSNDTALQIHILETHRNVNATILNLNCNTCKMSFETKSAYETHMQLHQVVENQKTLKPFPCKYCPAGFSRGDTLKAHIKLNHKEHHTEPTFQCNQCNRVFDKQNALTIHLKVHDRQRSSGDNVPRPIHNRNMYFCSICDVGFAIAKDLRTHVVTAHPF